MGITDGDRNRELARITRRGSTASVGDGQVLTWLNAAWTPVCAEPPNPHLISGPVTRLSGLKHFHFERNIHSKMILSQGQG